MSKLGKLTCLARGIWARRPGNPLGRQAVWFDHDFERINERDVFGIKWYDARCRRCGVIETGWRDALPVPGSERAIAREQEKAQAAKSGAKPVKSTKPAKPPKPAKAPAKPDQKVKVKR